MDGKEARLTQKRSGVGEEEKGGGVREEGEREERGVRGEGEG